jgi:hypothetical protein
MKQMILLLPLLLVTPIIAHAKNESSYKYGFETGFESYQCVSKNGDCDDPSSDNINTICLNKSPLMVIVSNSTACMDGYLNGWAHWCESDAKNCIIIDIPKPNYIKVSG